MIEEGQNCIMMWPNIKEKVPSKIMKWLRDLEKNRTIPFVSLAIRTLNLYLRFNFESYFLHNLSTQRNNVDLQ